MVIANISERDWHLRAEDEHVISFIGKDVLKVFLEVKASEGILA